jgi:UDP-N-acetylmuramoylalanine--D-glutamate ligase
VAERVSPSHPVPGWLREAGLDGGLPDWTGLPVVVAGLGVSGAAAARALRVRGADVTVVDAATDERAQERASSLEAVDVRVRLGDGDSLPEGTSLVVTSPGWRPTSPLFARAAEHGVPVWGEVELAWRLRPLDRPAPWLAVTGTNGKTTTVGMLLAMLRAAGLRAEAAGNVGTPLVEIASAAEQPDVIAVELSSFQLHWTESMRAHASVVLNLADDHVDWHGSFAAYAADKGRIHRGVEVAAVYNTRDARTEALVRDAEVSEGARAIGFGLGVPDVGQLGLVEDVLVDRAFVPDRRTAAAELATLEDIRPLAPHNVENALAAAALARSFGVPADAVREGLRGFRPDAHRIAEVAVVGDVTYVDDSKATNPHAAAASIASFESVVWVAGGLAKGADFDELVRVARSRLRAVVLLGAERGLIADALARHAPDLPVVDLDRTDTGVMLDAVLAASRLASPGDTVLLAPACASMDLFRDYGHRGDAFADAVGQLAR